MMMMMLQLGWRKFSHLKLSKIAREISFKLEETFLCPHMSGFRHPSKSILDMCRAGRFFCLFLCTSCMVSGFFEFLHHKLELCAHSLALFCVALKNSCSVFVLLFTKESCSIFHTQQFVLC